MAKATEEAPDEAVRRHVAAWVNATRPAAVRCRIVVDFADEGERDTIAVPLVPSGADDLAGAVLLVLGKVKLGEWMKGRSVAIECGIEDPGNGHFKRTLASLVGKGEIESSRNGYRIKQ